MSAIGKRGKAILLDITGVFLVIISPITGLVPGPGGIPVFLAGLGLLAVNHEWARRILDYVQTKGSKLADQIFVDHPVIKLAYDFVATVFFAVGIYLIFHFSSDIRQGFAVAVTLIGLSLFLGNRKRLKKLSRWIRHQTGHTKR